MLRAVSLDLPDQAASTRFATREPDHQPLLGPVPVDRKGDRPARCRRHIAASHSKPVCLSPERTDNVVAEKRNATLYVENRHLVQASALRPISMIRFSAYCVYGPTSFESAYSSRTSLAPKYRRASS
jgi:hypothetical protein